MTVRSDAYVYAIKVDGVIRYIGKGTKQRMFSHVPHANVLIKNKRKPSTNFYRQLVNAIRVGSLIETKIIAQGLSEEQAFYQEAVEIAKYPGQLWNTFVGGVGPTSVDMQRVWQRPGHREKVKLALSKPEERKRRADATKSSWQDPQLYEKRMASLQKSWDDEERRKKTSAQSKQRYSSSEERLKQSEKMKLVMSKEEVRDKQKKAQQILCQDEEFLLRRRLAIKEAYKNPISIERKRAATHAGWDDPIVRERRTKGVKAARQSAEAREKARVHMLGVWAAKKAKQNDDRPN